MPLPYARGRQFNLPLPPTALSVSRQEQRLLNLVDRLSGSGSGHHPSISGLLTRGRQSRLAPSMRDEDNLPFQPLDLMQFESDRTPEYVN